MLGYPLIIPKDNSARCQSGRKIAPWNGVLRVFSMNNKNEARNLDAMLRHVGSGRDLRKFPGTTTEKLALTRTAGARGLIEWRKRRARYELTSSGWNALMPKRRFGVASLIISAGTGAVAAVVAMVVFWLPADASRPRGNSSGSISQLERPAVLHAAAEICVPRYAPLPAMSVVQDAIAIASQPEGNEVPQLDHPDFADRPALDQPKAASSANGAKEAGAKKSRRIAHHRRRDRGRSWAYADPWRARSVIYAGYGGQRGRFGYR
jgi:hypothetical protein